ncbi:hypothetical protein NLU13_1367 [Sarocladium strictum]|uniref:histidine kinase n=1 Tax=Sarocladium strictum TaxID=5046 RepID=A0AA39GST5_SARSR|nr:hypothetical protein NLU13_1367 [Sarocladium strictum]
MAQLSRAAHFFPKADAALLVSPLPSTEPLAPRPATVGPIFDPANLNTAIATWDPDTEACFFPSKKDPYGPSSIPNEPANTLSMPRYVRATLTRNERLRLSMLWYYTQDIQNQPELLAGLQEKATLAQVSTGWEYAIIGILDMNVYIRLATVGVELAILPRGETLCAHTVCAPPGNVFMMPNMMEDWRFRESPYVEFGGLTAYAGVPLRMQHESGECVNLGSLCVASSTSQDPLSMNQQQVLARLGDWVVADIVQSCRTRRQRERHRLAGLVAKLQQDDKTTIDVEEAVIETLKSVYSNETVRLQSCKDEPIPLGESNSTTLFSTPEGFWEDTAYIDEIIVNSNHCDTPTDRTIRFISAHCESKVGVSLLVVASNDFRRIFDDVDLWFVQSCAAILTESWQKRLLSDVMLAKETFLRGVSHQLRTPIHGILGAAELLAEDLNKLFLREGEDLCSEISAALKPLASPKQSFDCLNTISSAGQELMTTVNSMIILNRWADIAQAKRKFALHPIHELEDELIGGLQAITKSNHKSTTSVIIQSSLNLHCRRIRVDVGIFRDSVLPLIDNAVQNTQDGVVTIDLSMDENTNTLVVDVKDNGCGVPQKDHSRIFELYEKVGELSTGAGLGLSLARKFSALLHGSVELVSSELGHGSHFRAVFQDVVHQPALSSSLQEKLPDLGRLPRQVHFVSPCEGSLSRKLEGLFTPHGFVKSDTMENSLLVVDYIGDAEKHRQNISGMPPNQVVICPVPASVPKKSLGPSSNVVYIEGPFSTSGIAEVLTEAETLISAMPLLDSDPPGDASSSSVANCFPPEPEKASSCWDTIHHPDSATPGSEEATAGSCGTERSTAASEVCDSDGTRDLSISTNISTTSRTAATPAALLVDDNAVNLRILEMYCKKRGIPYFSATDGEQAVAIYTEQQELAASGEAACIELVLMDLQMPICDGIKATQRIRQLEDQRGWAPSVLFIVTGQDSQTDRNAANEANADDFLVKPVGMKFLDERLRSFFPALNTP